MKDNEKVLCPTCKSKVLSRVRNAPHHDSQTSEYILLQSILKDIRQLELRIESRVAEKFII